jgi:DNA-binding NarL/FixJ family response regulator
VTRRVRVLVVDDHRMFAQSLLRILEDESDLDVVGLAGSGAEAVRLAGDHPADVVLLDYDLPDTDGVRCIAMLRAVLPDARFVMLTGHADADVLAAAIEAGCCGFITKDKATDELIDAVRAAGAGESVISPAMLAQLLPRLRHEGQKRDPGALTARERDVLALLADGLATDQIAARLFVSRNTVRNHVQRLMAKLGAHSRLEAVAIAVRQGVVGVPTRRTGTDPGAG